MVLGFWGQNVKLNSNIVMSLCVQCTVRFLVSSLSDSVVSKAVFPNEEAKTIPF